MQVIHLGTEDFFKGEHFSDENPQSEKDLQEYLNRGDEVKCLLQAAVLRAKRLGSHVKF